MVDRVPRQPQTQGARAHRLRLRGVGRGVVAPIPPPDLPRVAGAVLQDDGREKHEQRRKAGGDIVEHVVGAGGDLSEIQVAVLLVADHGIHGVDRLVQKPADCPAQKEVQKRGDDAVGGVFGDRFHRRAGDARLVQHARIPSDDHGNGVPRALGIPLAEFFIHLHALLAQAVRRQGEPAQERGEGEVGVRAEPEAQRKQSRGHARRHDAHAHDQKGAARRFARGRFGEYPAEPLFQQRDELADADDGVREPARVADQQVDDEADEYGIKGKLQQRYCHNFPSKASAFPSHTAQKPCPFSICQS